MKFRTITVLLGAVVASSFPFSAKFAPAGAADAADAVPKPVAPEIGVPEFVPVVNFSEFVLAVQTFAAQNPAPARIAAEALSAKFDFSSGSEQIEPRKPAQQIVVAAKPVSPPPVIVTRQVAVSDMPAASDPSSEPPQVPDPVKIVTGYSEQQPAPRKRHKAEKTAKVEKSEKTAKVATETPSSRARSEKRFEPAMGLGMVIDSAEEAPPISTLPQKNKKAASRDAE